MSNDPRILIVGAGAVGGYVGGYFARAGVDVTLVDPWPAHVAAMQANGITLEGLTPEECFTTPVRAIDLTDLQGLIKEQPIDIAFCCVKSYDTAWAATLINEYLAPGGFVVSLQNSINEDTIAKAVGWGRTIGCIAAKIAVELTEPAVIRRGVPLGGDKHTVFRVGEAHGRITPRIEQIRAMLADIDSAKTTSNLWGERWSKLVANAMANGVSAATGFSSGEFNAERITRRLSIRIAGEAARVGLAQGFDLEAINGLPAEIWDAAGQEADSGANDAEALRTVEDKLQSGGNAWRPGARPSMGQDIQKGRRTEIDYLNGLVARRGQELGIATPANQGLVDAVRQVERGTVAPGLDVVSGI
jgi:2-dehydropantoate 2-reductase